MRMPMANCWYFVSSGSGSYLFDVRPLTIRPHPEAMGHERGAVKSVGAVA